MSLQILTLNMDNPLLQMAVHSAMIMEVHPGKDEAPPGMNLTAMKVFAALAAAACRTSEKATGISRERFMEELNRFLDTAEPATDASPEEVDAMVQREVDLLDAEIAKENGGKEKLN